MMRLSEHLSGYQNKDLPRLEQRTAYFAPHVGVRAGHVQVRDLGYRWASCIPDIDLYFHWKCFVVSPTVIDYIVVHELYHLHHRNHSDVLWNEVEKVLPIYRGHKEWLRQRGANLNT